MIINLIKPCLEFPLLSIHSTLMSPFPVQYTKRSPSPGSHENWTFGGCHLTTASKGYIVGHDNWTFGGGFQQLPNDLKSHYIVNCRGGFGQPPHSTPLIHDNVTFGGSFGQLPPPPQQKKFMRIEILEAIVKWMPPKFQFSWLCGGGIKYHLQKLNSRDF